MPRITHSTQTVTPELAEKWLGRNESNRSVRPARVREYAEAMTGGRWVYTADPIRFDEDGRLIDGQHRLMAVVRCGEQVEMHVVRGLAREAQDAVDVGAVRTASDALMVRGMKHGSAMAATVPIVNWLLEQEPFNATYSRNEVVEWVEHHEGLAEIVDEAHANRALLPCQLAPYAAAYYAALQVSTDEEATRAFFVDQLVDTIGLKGGSPALALRKYLLKAREDRKAQTKTVKAATVLAILEAYRTYRAGKNMYSLRPPYRGWPVDKPVEVPD